MKFTNLLFFVVISAMPANAELPTDVPVGDVFISAGVRAVALSHSGLYLATGEKDGTITIWDVATHRAVKSERGHKEAVSSLAFSASDEQLASAGYDATVRIMSVNGKEPARVMRGHNGRVHCVSFSKSGLELVSAGADRTVRQWSVPDGKITRILRGHSGEVFSAVYSPDGELIASASEDATVRIWKRSDGTLVRKIRAGIMNVQYAAAFSPDGALLATAGEDAQIRYWRVVDGVLAKTSRSTGQVLALQFSRSGEQLASVGTDGALRVWRVSDGELVKQFAGHPGSIQAMSLPSTSGIVASAGADGAVRLLTMPGNGNPAHSWGGESAGGAELPVDTTEQAHIEAELENIPDYATKRQNAYAVIIGIEKYRDLVSAEYAGRDAQLVKKYFEKALGIPPEHILMRENDRASLGDLRSYFESWLRSKVTADSEVFVYYSGHGTPNPQSGQSFIVPYDALPETLQDAGYSLKRLYAVLGELPIKRALVILDSCFSGAGGPRTVLAQGVRPVIPVAEDEALASGKVAVISAASGTQISGTHRAARHGLLTYYMIKGLRGEAAKKDGSISLIDLYGYLLPKVVVDARNSHREQEPKLLPPASVGDPWAGEALATLK